MDPVLPSRLPRRRKSSAIGPVVAASAELAAAPRGDGGCDYEIRNENRGSGSVRFGRADV